MQKIKKVSFSCLILSFLYIFNFKISYSSSNHQELINILNKNYPLEITFEQFHNNKELKGWMLIGGKGKARTEFSPPNNYLIVADGRWLIFHDPEIERTTYIPLESGILQALLNPQSIIDTNKFRIEKKTDNRYISFSILLNLQNENQEVRIYFDKNNFNLKGWDITESTGQKINVKVISINKLNIEKINENFFKLTEKMRNSGKIYFGPYKRKIIKFLDNGRLN